jgi:hypothetical protein
MKKFYPIMLWINTGIAIYFGLVAMGCAVNGDHDLNVKGGTQNSIELNEKFCDEQTYPTVAERRACKDALLAAMQCQEKKP